MAGFVHRRPANHSPPICVAPFPGAPGYEAVVTCLAAPEVRARTAGVVAWRVAAGEVTSFPTIAPEPRFFGRG
jgi:hypothetical protein